VYPQNTVHYLLSSCIWCCCFAVDFHNKGTRYVLLRCRRNSNSLMNLSKLVSEYRTVVMMLMTEIFFNALLESLSSN